jgi:N-terminal acetyltransferase B complex non-catalytic subunit
MTLFSSDRNWLEFLSVLDATFSDFTQPPGEAVADPIESKKECVERISKTRAFFFGLAQNSDKDRSGLLALLELEKRARIHGLSTGN